MRKAARNIALGFLPLTIVILFAQQMAGTGKRDETGGPNTTAMDGLQDSSSSALTLPLVNPRIVVSKSKRQLELYSNGVVVRRFAVGLGFNPTADKTKEGDGCTPEGEFYIFTKNPRSAYHLSLGVSYPNAEDAARGLRDRLISKAEHDAIIRANDRKKTPPQYTALGGLIYIHGNGAKRDWTLGCIALENQDMTELFNAVSVGMPITIKP